MKSSNQSISKPVAVVGMSLRVPGARTLEQFWGNLMKGRDCLRRLSRAELEHAGVPPRALADPLVIPANPILDGIEFFDAEFFDIAASQAEQMDPAHRLFLECTWEAMEHGGVVVGDNQQKIGVFAGVEGNYLHQNLVSPHNGNTTPKYIDPAVRVSRRLGNSIDYFTMRVSHQLNLIGPSFTPMATCSTSLLAVHLAVQNLRLGECTAAVVGGAKIELPKTPVYRAGMEGMLSTSGRVRPFDADADGTIFGNGVAVVVLKLLEDAVKDGNPVYGVIRGTGFCNDGNPADKKSFIAPTPSGQKRAIRHALDEAAVDARTISFIESHGTGTLLGDPTEVASLTEVFRDYSSDTGYCALGSVKGNVGHLGAAAGAVSLIKTCLALTKGIVPPMANFERPNPEIDFEASPFFINTCAVPWAENRQLMRAGVSAFGFGGSNAHVVMEGFAGDSPVDVDENRSRHLLVVSAKTERALQRRVSDLAIFVEDHPQAPLRDIAHTLQCGRRAMAWRTHVLVDDQSGSSVADQLRSLKPGRMPHKPNRPVVLLFPGQGSQLPGMGQGLYDNEPVYRKAIDYCAEFLEKELGFDVRKRIRGNQGVSDEEAKAALAQTSIAQPALFVVEYALARLFQHWGLRPNAMLGHSLGELVAACLAGVFSLEDGLHTVAVRSRLMQKCDPGSMVALLLPLSELLDILPDDLDLAAVNSPTNNVVAGPTKAVERFVSELDAKGIHNRMLETSHAFHSRMLDATLEEFRRELAKLQFNTPRECIISNVTGLPMTNSQALDHNYWVEQLRQPVRFSNGLTNFLMDEDPIFVEMGPGRVLSGFVVQHDPAYDTVTAMFRPDEDASANEHQIAIDSLGAIWSMGADIDWSVFSSPQTARKISLPVYPFQQRFHWQDLSKDAQEGVPRYPLHLYEPGWTKREIEGDRQIEHRGDWLVFADDKGIADELVIRLRESARTVTVVEVGDRFQRISNHRYELAPGSRDQLHRLLSDMPREDDSRRLRVLHFWALNGDHAPETEIAAFKECSDRGFHTLIALMQAAHECGSGGEMDVQIYVDGLAQVDSTMDALYPEKGSLLGPCLVMPQEIPGLTMRCIDIPGDLYASSKGSLADDIFGESAVDSDKVLTALRPDGRYVENLFELPEISQGLPRLRYGATVLITGGVGGLGLKIAEFLYETLQVRLVLTSRWQSPPREEWSDYAQQNTKLGRALKVLSQLVNQGAEVLIVKADVCNRDDMEGVVAEANKAFGCIHGIVHAAGVLDDGPALHKTRERTDKVLAAKVVSAYVLEELFENHPLDIFVYFSSLASVRPNKGQVDYSAANAVLDRLARRRRQNYPGLACAIGWGAWRDAGMAWEYAGSSLGSTSLFQHKLGVEFDGDLHELRHPILKTYRKYCDGDVLFSGSIRRGEHWITKEHLIDGRPVLSATTILEMFRAGFAELNPGADAIEMTRFVIYEPLVIDDSIDYEILYVTGRDGCDVELRIHRNEPGTTWSVNSSAAVRGTSSDAVIDPAVLHRLRSIGQKDVKSSQPISHGPRWHCDWVGDKKNGSMVAHVQLQEQFRAEVDQFGLHPAIFDRSIHTITEQLLGLLLPYTCERLCIHGQLPAETLAFGRPSNGNIEAHGAYDFVITDCSGKLLVEIEGYVMRTFGSKRRHKWDRATLGEKRRQDRAMVLGKPGLLSSFEVGTVSLPPLQSGQVRIDVKAAGVNFRDVLSALGKLPEGDKSRNMIGCECSGIVSAKGKDVTHVRVGDRVVAAANNCFATGVVADGHSVTYLPEALSFTEGAGIPLTFLTVDYALNQLAHLQAGEKILIHSATGGVGLAAIQMALKVGAEVFATAGSESKRSYLHSIGIDHVMDSRSLQFVDEVKARTEGDGVDVVLNALAGEYIPASLGLLRPFGRFLEFGKSDIFADSKLGLYPFRNNLSYFAIDLGQFISLRPNDLLQMFENLMQQFATGGLRPSPVKQFPLKDIGKAFELMARAEHIGKIVLAVEENMEQSDIDLDRFRSQFGDGIRVNDGLEVFRRFISSDETPSCVTAAANPLAGGDTVVRYQPNVIVTRAIDTPFREARNASEELLQGIWEKQLGISPIGIDDDFLDLGGDSITAILIQNCVEQAFGTRLSFAILFRHSSIAKLSQLISEQSSG